MLEYYISCNIQGLLEVPYLNILQYAAPWWCRGILHDACLIWVCVQKRGHINSNLDDFISIKSSPPLGHTWLFCSGRIAMAMNTPSQNDGIDSENEHKLADILSVTFS